MFPADHPYVTQGPAHSELVQEARRRISEAEQRSVRRRMWLADLIVDVLVIGGAAFIIGLLV